MDILEYSHFNSDARRLRFPLELEEEYLKNYFLLTITAPLKSIIIASLIYLAYFVLDIFAAPIHTDTTLNIRMLVAIPAIIVSAAIYNRKIKTGMYQTLFCLMAIVAGLGIIIIIYNLSPAEIGRTYYPAGLILVIIFACSGIMLRFWYALLATLTLIVVFNIMAFINPLEVPNSSGTVHLIHNFNLIGASFLSLFACYSLEVYSRMDFLQRKTIEAEKHRLDKLVLQLESKNIEIQEQQRRMELIKDQSIKAEMASLRLTALRSQMNPHFLFNCMNTIEAYIVSHKPQEASEFLQKFSKLIRSSLEYSNSDGISLKDELETLKLYLQLEQIRANHGFTFQIKLDESLLRENFIIPPLIIQPYVENAILHGIHFRETSFGRILIHLLINAENLICTVEDNGIGIEQSLRNKSLRMKNKQSLAMAFTKERLIYLAGKVSVTDLSLYGRTGTRVIITIPIKYMASD
ncbi:sensor histidine kinase [Dyadobacter sp. NIV53]|uniref:sensor histidine kinase n=1 Tax=Dyadobacter sp. NIV53 TaxID=2861765 RepID=UPI001C878901|nr:histidine kinase [Dyadobacter sp. NIV53]